MNAAVIHLPAGVRKIAGVIKARPVLFTVLGLFLIIQSLNFSGFCYSQGRYLSSQEFIDKAVVYNLARHGPRGERNKLYKSVAEFYQANPDCCTLTRWEAPSVSSILLRMFGLYQFTVHVIYRMTDDPISKPIYVSIVNYDACGSVGDAVGYTKPAPWPWPHDPTNL